MERNNPDFVSSALARCNDTDTLDTSKRDASTKELTMTSYIGYHCSPVKDAELSGSVARSLCIADSDDAAKSYRRGDSYDAPYYVYEVQISGKICGPKSCDKFCSELGHESLVERGLTYEVMKLPAVRAWFVAEGFDAVRYGDTNDGFDYECCEIFSQDVIVSVKCVEILNEEETEDCDE